MTLTLTTDSYSTNMYTEMIQISIRATNASHECLYYLVLITRLLDSEIRFLHFKRSEQVAGTYNVARWHVADSQRAYGCVYMCSHIYIYVCTRMYMHMSMHVYVLGLCTENHLPSQRTSTPYKIKVNNS